MMVSSYRYYEYVSTRHPLASHILQGRPVKCITGKKGSCEQFLKALYWHLYEKVPVNYQLVHDTLGELEALHNKLNQLERIHSDVQAVHKELLYLKKKWGHCSDNTRENVTLTNDCWWSRKMESFVDREITLKYIDNAFEGLQNEKRLLRTIIIDFYGRGSIQS